MPMKSLPVVSLLCAALLLSLPSRAAAPADEGKTAKAPKEKAAVQKAVKKEKAAAKAADKAGRGKDPEPDGERRYGCE